jgi:tetratricopeptide (TPR) repeat protein
LPSFGLCTDVAALRAATPARDPDTRSKIDGVRRELATASALELGGRNDRGLGVARAALATAEALKEPRVVAEAELTLARLLDSHGDYADSMRAYHQALVAAVDAHADEDAARATIGLVDENGTRLSRFDEADRWAALADAEVRQLPRQDDVLGRYYMVRSTLRRTESRYDEALADAQHALEIQERVLGRDHYTVGETWLALGSLQRFRAQLPQALDAYRRAIAIWKHALGPDHPRLASAIIGLGDVYGEQGDHERAIAEYVSALATLERVQPNHPNIAVIHNDLGSELISLGKLQAGFDEYKRALDSWTQRLGPSMEQTIAFNNLGEAKLVLDAPAEALRYLQRGQDLCARHFGSDHLCGLIERNIGECYRQMARPEQALGQFRRSLASMEKALGPKHPALASTLLGIGRVEVAQGDATDALATLQRALAIALIQPGDGSEVAEVRFALAEATWALGKHADARALALQAQKVLAAAGPFERKQLAETNAWLERHR